MGRAQGMTGAIQRAQDLLRTTPDSFMLQQFDNPANSEVHYKSTGPEIWRDTAGQVDILVCGRALLLTGVLQSIVPQQHALQWMAGCQAHLDRSTAFGRGGKGAYQNHMQAHSWHLRSNTAYQQGRC